VFQMDKADKVSVVVPTYNGASFISEALSSVLAQTHLPAEIVVIDDHSNDGTSSIVEAISQNAPVPIRCIRLPKNSGGPGRPLNLGVESASNEIVVVLEHDDVMRPQRIEKQLAALRAYPECSMVTGRFSLCGNSDGDMMPLWPVPQFDGVVEDIDSKPEYFVLDQILAFRGLLTRQIAGGNSNYCFTKDSWRKLGGFNERVRTCVDVDFVLRAILAGPVVVVNDFIMEYRLLANSLCRQDLDSSIIEVTLVRLRFASMKRDLAGDNFRDLQTTALGFARVALEHGDWQTLAAVLPAVIKHTDFLREITRKTARYIRASLDTSGTGRPAN
jgi:glycosyltransferase involved in cell wall biosynthesis